MALTLEQRIISMLHKAGPLHTKQLVPVLEGLGYHSGTVRNTLTQLKARRWIRSAARSLYEITDKGKSHQVRRNAAGKRYGMAWDGKWYVFTGEIPESERNKRDRMRSDLMQMGCGRLYKSVYITPWDITGDVLRMAEEYGIVDYISIFHGEKVAGAISKETVVALWPLAEVVALYEEVLNRMNLEWRPRLAKLLASDADCSLELLLLYMEVDQAIEYLIERDPMLPEELLPDAWAPPGILVKLEIFAAELADAVPAGTIYGKLVRG
ncbi:PaaX family transcriptional regulator C-terminal domain-containing protein [Xylanibacillus composti]|uniref:PaaX family transcriptional regulator n=1 Tax=Xylanibacillus composti TaxID=1572762 RepID=A0A8J4M4L7_9BACL|nr:PaaX family transcriptional regulator C-terminal domain-containing protein [Xylanibacillus composti]GIQ71315.1 hypothetical protein XYCOK13_41390 [Xylanibacillus composti]